MYGGSKIPPKLLLAGARVRPVLWEDLRPRVGLAPRAAGDGEALLGEPGCVVQN